MMLKSIGLLLSLGLPAAATAQSSPPPSDLRQLVEAMQKAVKPTIGQPLPPRSTSNMASVPLPLIFNGSPAPLDSLNRHTLSQVATVALSKKDSDSAIYGTMGTWGIIEVTLKKKSSK